MLLLLSALAIFVPLVMCLFSCFIVYPYALHLIIHHMFVAGGGFGGVFTSPNLGFHYSHYSHGKSRNDFLCLIYHVRVLNIVLE